MTLGRFVVLAGLVTIAVSPRFARAQEQMRHGWSLSVRLGLSIGRVACDSPCVAPRSHAGLHAGVFVGHSVGDRAVLGAGSTGFSAGKRNSEIQWGAGGFGIEGLIRPTPTSDNAAFAFLGIGDVAHGPRRGGPSAVVATWAIGANHDDVGRGFGPYAEAHGTIGGKVPSGSDGAGRAIRALGIAAGVQATR